MPPLTGLAELGLRLGVACLVLGAAVIATRLPVGWLPARFGPPSRPARRQPEVPEEVAARLELAVMASAEPARFNAPLVDRLLALAEGRPAGRVRLFDAHPDAERRERLARESMGQAGAELAQGQPPTPERVQAAAGAMRQRWGR